MWQSCQGWFGGTYGGFGWLMPITMVVLGGLVLWGIVALVRGPNRYSHSIVQAESALEVLKRRYVNGEMSREEFEERKRTLS